jgi:hypothetical protein
MKARAFRTLSVLAAALTGSIVAASPRFAVGAEREPVVQQELKMKPERRLMPRAEVGGSSVAFPAQQIAATQKSPGSAALEGDPKACFIVRRDCS